MNQKKFLYIILIVVIIIFVVIGGYFIFLKKPIAPTESNFQFDEIVQETIGVDGGILQNVDKSVAVTIPPLKQDTELTLSFKRSNYTVRSGTGSPVTISISPDSIDLIDSATPISIKVKYDKQYNLAVGYLIDEKNQLHAVDFGGIDKENYYFTMLTFHGGDYSWIYVTK